MKIREANGAMDLVICGTTVRNKDEEFETFWDLREYRMGDYTRWLRGLLRHFDKTDALSSCVPGQRGTIAKSMYEEHLLCGVALTSIERGTRFFPLASYFLV